MKMLTIEVSLGEAVDRWTILKIKEKYIPADNEKRSVVLEEVGKIEALIPTTTIKHNLTFELRLANEKLWFLEERIRQLNVEKDVYLYVSVAESIHTTNDERSRLKAAINKQFSCNETEVKFFKKES